MSRPKSKNPLDASGVYGIRNKNNSAIYIGHSRNIKKRWQSGHLPQLRKGNHGNKNLQFEWNQYHEEDFEIIILETCPQKDLPKLERKWKDYYVNQGVSVYNINNIRTETKKIRRGKEAKNYHDRMSLVNRGEHNPHNTKFTDESVAELKYYLAEGLFTNEELAQMYHTTKGYIGRIAYGYRWKHIKISIGDDEQD